jgi:hypothetical protein
MLVLAAVAMPTRSYADSLVRAEKEDIKRLLHAATGMNSANGATYIGETRDRVYIEYNTIIHASSLFSNAPKRIVYWLPRSELTDEQLDHFKTYKANMEKLFPKPQPNPSLQGTGSQLPSPESERQGS